MFLFNHGTVPTRWALVLIAAVLAVITAAVADQANAGVPSTFQPVIAYGQTTRCIQADKPAWMQYTVKNVSDRTVRVVLRPWGVFSAAEAAELQYGPLLIADIATSKLMVTEHFGAWHWEFTLLPGKAVKRTLRFTAPEPYGKGADSGVGLPENFSWYLSANAMVRNSRFMVPVTTIMDYCEEGR